MIYTVTFNPSIDYVVKVDNLEFGHTNRSCQEALTVGGKGINVSLVLEQFGISSTALGFIGGFTGDQLENMLRSDLVKSDFVRTCGGNTRINVKIIEKDMTEINACGPTVSADEVNKPLDKIDNIKAGDTLVIAGSVPKGVSDEIYENILSLLEGRGVKTIVDATGKLLMKTLKYRPYLIKPNIDELGAIFGVKIACENDILKYATDLQNMGAQNVLVSMGENGAILLAADGNILKRKAVGTVTVNPVGAGDSMVAGFIAGSSSDYATALEYGIAAGGATACSEGLASKEMIDRFLQMIDDNK